MDWEVVLRSIDEILRPEIMFEGSCDFLLGWELLGAYTQTPAVREDRAFVPIQARATCASMALELALLAILESSLRPAGAAPPVQERIRRPKRRRRLSCGRHEGKREQGQRQQPGQRRHGTVILPGGMTDCS